MDNLSQPLSQPKTTKNSDTPVVPSFDSAQDNSPPPPPPPMVTEPVVPSSSIPPTFEMPVVLPEPTQSPPPPDIPPPTTNDSFVQSPPPPKKSSKKILLFAIVLFLLITIPLTVYLAKQRQEIRQRAAVYSVCQPGSVASCTGQTVADPCPPVETNVCLADPNGICQCLSAGTCNYQNRLPILPGQACDRDAPEVGFPNCTDKATGSSCGIRDICQNVVGATTGVCQLVDAGGGTANGECVCVPGGGGPVPTPTPTPTPSPIPSFSPGPNPTPTPTPPPGASPTPPVPTPTPQATPTPSLVAACSSVKIYRVTGSVTNPASWQLLTSAQLTTLRPGDVIYVTTLGTVANGAAITRARIRVNSSVWTDSNQTTLLKPKALSTDPNEYYILYTIPSDGTINFNVGAEVYSPQFDDNTNPSDTGKGWR